MNSAYRQLYIFQSLLTNHILNKSNLADHFDVTERAIQRDFSQIKQFIFDQQLPYQLTYSRKQSGYQLTTTQDQLSKQTVLLLIKILLASRSLNKTELNATITSLLATLPHTEQAEVQPIIKNEFFYYQPLRHQQDLIALIWQLSRFIAHQTTIDIDYRNSKNHTETRTILPQTIIFSEYYFYVVAYSAKYQTNRYFRLDRIFNYHLSKQKIHRSRAEHVSGGQLRQVVQFMQPGEKVTIQFEFSGVVEAALDRFPTARVITAKSSSHTVLIETEVVDNGAIMWLLSQGPLVKVISPASFVQQIRESLAKTLKQYSSEKS